MWVNRGSAFSRGGPVIPGHTSQWRVAGWPAFPASWRAPPCGRTAHRYLFHVHGAHTGQGFGLRPGPMNQTRAKGSKIQGRAGALCCSVTGFWGALGFSWSCVVICDCLLAEGAGNITIVWCRLRL